jgi:hypothetical protein
VTTPQQPSNGNGSASKARGSTRVITKVGQLVGLGLGIAEWIRPGPAQDSVLLFCVALVLGAEAVESLALRLIDKVLDRDS